MTSFGSDPATGAGEGGTLLVRGGHVITMDPGTGDVPGGDVLVSGGAIAAVGTGLAVPAGARVIDATGMIVAPGLVDTHWHMWNTLLRGMSETGPGYFRLCRGLGPAFGPGDVFHGTLLACAEAISSGITTVHDWAHNVRGPGRRGQAGAHRRDHSPADQHISAGDVAGGRVHGDHVAAPEQQGGALASAGPAPGLKGARRPGITA